MRIQDTQNICKMYTSIWSFNKISLQNFAVTMGGFFSLFYHNQVNYTISNSVTVNIDITLNSCMAFRFGMNRNWIHRKMIDFTQTTAKLQILFFNYTTVNGSTWISLEFKSFYNIFINFCNAIGVCSFLIDFLWRCFKISMSKNSIREITIHLGRNTNLGSKGW